MPVQPQGDFTIFVAAPKASAERIVKGEWAWKNNGRSGHGVGHQPVYFACLGVMECKDCPAPTRPEVRPRGREIQLANVCGICGSGRLVYIGCKAKAQLTPTNDPHIYQFRHIGRHAHKSAPDKAKVVASQAAEFSAIVLLRPEAKPLELRTGRNIGNPVLEIKPVTDISPAYNNLQRVAKDRKKVLRLPVFRHRRELDFGRMTSMLSSRNIRILFRIT